MGGRVGSQFDVVITGEHLYEAGELVFSDPRIRAKQKLDSAGKPVPNRYVVKIAADCPTGLYEARVLTRLGVSSARIFPVGTLTEVTQKQPNRTLEAAQVLPLNCVCNGFLTQRSVDYYKFQAKKDQRLVVDCAARGIDSKLNPTVIIADAQGRDVVVDRRGGVLDFKVPTDGTYVIKIHELTFDGGPAYYYRLGLWEQPANEPIVRQPSTKAVNSFSWPPFGLPARAKQSEVETNDDGEHAQRITLPCDIAGRFYPAADADVFEFEAKKGEVWWIELASQRLGLPTDPTVLVQKVVKGKGSKDGKLTDVLQLTDIPSPVRVSSNGYAYDGPAYNPGSADCLGKLAIKEDGLYRLQVSDLFGGTRSERDHVYRLVIRRAAPDFSLVAWALHMQLRNGDRNALSKPIALRNGATMALEVIAIRRDGFNGDIELSMEGLPKGVRAKGLKIAAGKSRGLMLVTADPDAPRGYANATFVGRSTIGGTVVTRPCRLASFSWPIPDHWREFPNPRLLGDVPVSVSGIEQVPLSIASEKSVVEAKEGEKLTIPLVLKRNSKFSGSKIKMRAIGCRFERVPAFDLPIQADRSQVVLDLKKLKVKPGEYHLSCFGGGVVKYCHDKELVASAEATSKKMLAKVKALQAELKKVSAKVQKAPAANKAKTTKALAAVKARMKVATDALNATQAQLRRVRALAKPKDIADIVVCEPITIRVQPVEKKR